MELDRDQPALDSLITASRSNFAISYSPPATKLPKKQVAIDDEPEADLGILA
jgi:hypothetical protein